MCEENNDLVIVTRDLLASRPANLELQTLALELDVSVDWLSKLMRGKIDDPGARKIQKLYERLTGKRLLNV